ncbi:hypothetical protein AJ80_03911 [Polytolypa hystricis UAMH7299]|uniref:Fe2OG dioxygenase domain-containing protein n=1 Tax=Polytolypa hystricis (strain UAMH7299) TaxID=1447883 RepID=A0A2B7YED9_POLH7|nr:hypothetical protein AJ80_03911 [Polytolypa hystricis UAMH7299]
MATQDCNPTSTGVDKDDLIIPVIDFAPFLTGTPSDRKAVGLTITNAFKHSGFIYLKNHGIPSSIVQTVFGASAKFFARPQHEKDDLGWTDAAANRGYVAKGREKLTQSSDVTNIQTMREKTPDLKETFEIGRDDEEGRENKWPDNIDEEGKQFTADMKSFFATCKDLHIEVMRALALGLGLPELYFDEFTSGGDNTLRLLHYPSVSKNVFKKNEGQVRAGEHTDYGSVTLLFQDDRGGLQVRSPRDTFIDATPIPDTIVVNAGDLLARWSNDEIKSTMHRVVEPPSRENASDDVIYPARYSVAYFCNPNFDKFIDVLPGTYGGEKGEKKYSGINSGDYVMQRLAATY